LLRYAYYYAHIDRYADGIKEGMDIKPATPSATLACPAIPIRTRRTCTSPCSS
jgi:hypothetical protein